MKSSSIFFRCLHEIERTSCSSLKTTNCLFARAFSFRSPFDYTKLLKSCASLKTVQQIHAQVVIKGHGQDPLLSTKLISQYFNLGGISAVIYARQVFDGTIEKDVFLRNVMIRGYATRGPYAEALILYDQMLQNGILLNCHTYTFVLKACAASGLGEVRKGMTVHCRVLKYGLESDLYVGNTLIPFYAKFGDVNSAWKVFAEITDKDLVSWNSMIAGYSHNSCLHDALLLFRKMLRSIDDGGHGAIVPDHYTLVSVLPVCAKLVAVREGLWIHCYVVKFGIEMDAALGSGLVMMYAGCGRLSVARLVFNTLIEKNLVVWNAMIRGYGMHGHASEAVELFLEMLETGTSPDAICFTSVLSACSHAGMVEKGREFFDMMENYNIKKTELHYACIVDLLGRAGQVEKAVEFISNMPVEPGKDVWGALLGACRIYGHLNLAEEVAEKLFRLDPDNAGRYSILARMYENADRWEDAAKMRLMMKERGVRKPLGYSAIEVESAMHVFGVEDDSHPMSWMIYEALEGLEWVIKEMNDEADAHV